MNRKPTAIRTSIYFPVDDAKKIRDFACMRRLSERRAIQMLVVAGLHYLDDKEAESDLLARFHREYHVRNHELSGMLVELVLGVRFLTESHTAGTAERLRTRSKEALAGLQVKITNKDRQDPDSPSANR